MQRCSSAAVAATCAQQDFSGEEPQMSKPRISYIDPATVKDPAMVAEFERCAREGTPRPESQVVRAHVPATFWSFANTWRDVFKNGVADHKIKELCRIYVSRSVMCEFCGNQRSIKAAKSGLKEDDYSDLINFESSTRYNDTQKAALSYAEAITWDLPCDDAFWARLHKHFSEPELVEIGYFVAITMGQQRWLRTLNIEHHQILVGAGENLVVLDVERAQPALLAHGDGNKIADLDQLRLAEMLVQPRPERVVAGQVPGYGLGIRQCGLLRVVVAG